MSNQNLCKNCGAVITGSTCDYCGFGVNAYQSNIKKTKDSRKLKELEKKSKNTKKKLTNSMKEAEMVVYFMDGGLLGVL